MKKLVFILSMLMGYAYGQVCAAGDTVSANTVSLITYNSARVNGTLFEWTIAVTGLQLRYVRVGQTDTATASGSFSSALRNLTGLQANTQYRYYYRTICGSGTKNQTGVYTFTTLANTVTYTPMDAMGYQYKYIKVDSGLMIPRRDTTIGRAPNYGGSIVFKTSDSLFYGYNGLLWKPLAIDSFGIVNALNHKVDSVTVNSDSLFYWINGTSYGYVLPALANNWKTTGNSSTVAGTNFIGTNDAVGLMFKTNGVQSGYIDLANQNTSFGYATSVTGSTGYLNSAFGYQSLNSNTTGAENTAMGANSLSGNITGVENVAVGVETLADNEPGNNNIAIGHSAGRYQNSLNNRLYINSLDRTNHTGDSAQSIIYGYQDATAASQRLYLNSQVYLPYAASGVGTKAMRYNPSTGLLTYSDTTIGNAGTVTSIATGLGLSGGTITTSGTLLLDTASASVISRQRAAATYLPLAGATYTTTTGTGLDLTSSTVTSGNLMKLTNTGTAAGSNTKNVLSIVSSGANATASQTVTGQTISVTNTGTTNTNVGLNVTASGATNNYAALFTGSVGIGTAAPARKLDVTGTGRFTDSVSLNHLIGNSAIPTIVAGAAAGSSGTASLSTNSNDLAGEIVVNTNGGSPSGQDVATITFATAYTTAPFITIIPSNEAASDLIVAGSPYYVTSTTSGFTIKRSSTYNDFPDAQTFKFFYHVIQ